MTQLGSSRESLDRTPSIELRDVSFAWGPQLLLRGVDLELWPGDFAVLTGPNGSGKSTLVRLILGLLTPTSGSVRLMGRSPTDPAARRLVGYAPQGSARPSALPVSVQEVVAAGITSRGPFWRIRRGSDGAAIGEALRHVGLGQLARECLFELSGGQQQRAALARALVGDPPVLLLDEPTTGIDREFRPTLIAELRRRAAEGATVVAVSHDPEDFHPDPEHILTVEDWTLRRLTHAELHREREVKA
jgi:zinc transport system ATP-binding protein